MSEITSYIGYIGCFLLSIFLIPQVLKTYNTKKNRWIVSFVYLYKYDREHIYAYIWYSN